VEGTGDCADDWHVILLADIDGGDQTFTEHDAVADIGSDSIVFTLDGAPLPSKRTALKRMLNPEKFGLQTAFFFQQGAIMSPSALSVGQHSVGVQLMSPSSGFAYDSTIQIFIDPSGTGACI
jgi:hypothetical protein